MRASFGKLAPIVLLTVACTILSSDPAVAQREADSPSLVSLSSGALVVQKAQEYGDEWATFWILHEVANSGWATPKGVTGNQTIVIEMPQKSLLKSLEFDTASIDGPGRGAKDVLVEISDSSPTAGFQTIAQVTLADRQDNQKFPVGAQIPGRWVRLTIKNNHGDPEYVELMDFRARGERVANTPFPDISGTYATNYGNMHLRQQGNSMVGCYEWDQGLLEGGIEGRVMRVVWRQGGADNPTEGPAVLVFSGDGKEMFGLWWYKGEKGRGSVWSGTRKSSAVGSCPNWKGDLEQQMASDLDKFGKTLVYGIVFDTGSDHIKDESRSTLDKIVALLKENAGLRLSVEGHTDSTGSAQHNQDLSVRRAKSVVAYLTGAGISAERLSPAGFGATRPVATNDTAIGRAQNRRVELVKK